MSLLGTEGFAQVAPQGPSKLKRVGGLPTVPHFKAKAKRVIYLFQSGAPSQMDLFDPKPVLDGWVADAARTFPVGPVSPVAHKLLKTTEESLFAAVPQCRPGNRLGDVIDRKHEMVCRHDMAGPFD